MVYVRPEEWSYIKCFQFTFTTLSTIGFGDYFPQFKNNADYSRVLPAFACAVFSAVRVVRSLREKNAKKCSKEKSRNNNEQLPRKGNEKMTEVYNDCKKGDLNNSLLKTGDSTNQDDVPISGSGRNRNNYEKQKA